MTPTYSVATVEVQAAKAPARRSIGFRMHLLLERHRPMVFLVLLTLTAVLVQGYHLGIDDAEIYLPAIKQFLNPHLYPVGAEFFRMHARLEHLAVIVGESARLLRLSADSSILVWYVGSVFLLLLASWRLAQTLFTSKAAAWGAVLLLALTLSTPVAGTALVIADPYLTARSLSTPLALFAIDAYLREKNARALLWLALMAFVHPLMVVYTAGFLGCLLAARVWHSRRAWRPGEARLAAILPLSAVMQSLSMHPATGAYRQLLYGRTFFFASMWHWYEWVGVIAPLLLLLAFSRTHLRGVTHKFARVCQALLLFASGSTIVWLSFSLSPRCDSLERLQPMRSFHILYVLFFLMLGGLLVEYGLRARAGRWLLFFGCVALGMFGLNVALYPSSPHLELPGRAGSNPWLATFFWIRHNTPEDAVFALDPEYTALPGEDGHGFRAVAERSRMTDDSKDSGVAIMFPSLFPEWAREQQALRGWTHFTRQDFQRLHRQFGVTWVVLTRPSVTLPCPFRSGAVRVCRID